MFSKDRADQVFGGIFLVGLALLFITGDWFPGVMFVWGIASLAKTYTEGKPLTDNRGALITLAVGCFFVFDDVLGLFGGNWLAIILILIGGYMLFGNRLRGGSSESSSVMDADVEKPKNDML